MTEAPESIKVSRKFIKAKNKVTRAYLKAAFFYVAMILIEGFFPRYRDFNTVRRTTIGDVFGFFEPLQEIPWLSSLSMLYSLVLVGLILLLPTYFKALGLLFNPSQESKQIRKLRQYHSRIDYVYYAAFLGLFFVVLNTFFMSIAQVSGASMEPQFFDQDDVLIQHQMNDLERGDIVVVQDPSRDNVYLVKRVIGLPGETLEIITGRVYINDEVINETYLSSDGFTACSGQDVCTVDLASDEYFLMGDNRPNSNDSRRMGPFSIDDFLGEVIVILRPFDRAGRVQP
jgi:signal peptidase I